MENTKYCKKCEETKEVTEFYKIGKTNSYQCLCIICHNEKRRQLNKVKYIPKLKGIAKYDIEIITGIKKDIELQIPLTVICKKYDIKYPKLYSWVYQKKI